MDDAAALWLVVTTGAASGLLSSLVGYALLGLPLVKIKTRHDLHVNNKGARVESYVLVVNTRGRPVRIEHVWIRRRRTRGRPRMSRPKGWILPQTLLEGEVVKFTFDRDEYPNAVAIAIDSAERVWPRRRSFWVRRQALSAGSLVGWPWQRNGPTSRQIERALKRLKGDSAP
jgi:hypothetical protein